MKPTETDTDYEGHALAILRSSIFKNGVIETEIAGHRRPDAPNDMRGFVGIAFRVQPSQFECFFIHPTNGRADDQLRRNHATQYISHPEYPWVGSGTVAHFSELVVRENFGRHDLGLAR